jgi:hypothetical protein
MFQDTRSRQTQDDQSKEQQKKAQDTAEETQRRMQNEALTRTLDAERQNIDGKMRDVQVAERRGATQGQVAAKAEEMVMGSVDFDLSRTAMPSFLEDNRNELRYAIRREIMNRVAEIEPQREERDKHNFFSEKKPE